jgi:hypothetical protein
VSRMRFWLFHPLIFYPMVLALAVLVIGLSLKPQLMPRPAGAVAGTLDGPAVLLDGDAFNSPVDPPQQYVTVVRNFWGQPQSLRIAVLPGMGDPDAQERGVEIRLAPETARMLANRPLIVEIAYQPLPVTAAPALGVAALGPGPVRWVSRPVPPLSGITRFDLPRTPDLQGIGLRAIHNDSQLAYGVEILSIHISPRGD